MEADPFEPLRRDVSALGRILGEALIELEGTAFFDLEERIRALSKERRERPALTVRRKPAADLRTAIAQLDTPTAERVGRAFAHYFQVVNLAEQYHRVRRYRDYARAGESRLGPLAELVPLLKAIPRTEAQALLERATIELVFTAHPTEAQRRTVLDKHRRIADLLERTERGDATEEELEGFATALREEITILWQTEEIRQERPRVGDEVKNALFYIEEILYPLIPRVYATIERALEEAYGEKVRVPPLLTFGSWVGADMDGNPNVTPEIALDTAFAQAARAVALHMRQVDWLGGRLSQSWRRAGVSRELLDSLRHDYALHPALAAALEPRPSDEPYRQKLRWIGARLGATREAFVRGRTGAATEFGIGYATAEELRADLALIERSLEGHGGAHAGLAEVRGVMRQVEVFGFHLTKLDVRVPAAWVRASVREVLGLEPDAPIPVAALHDALSGPVPARPSGPRPSLGMQAMDGLLAMRRRVSARSTESFILSMTHGHEDMLAALVLARIAGLYRPEDRVADLSIVPLFETLDDLERCPLELSRAIADPAYREYLNFRGGSQEVMVGYSDSNKDAGIVASSLALYTAQKGIVEVEHATGMRVKVFHGRGGSIGRGGGPSRRAIEGLPPGSLDGRFKLTEQGEVLGWKYLLAPIAERNLELTVSGVLGASVPRPNSNAAFAEYEAAFARVAAVSLEAYRGLVRHPRFVEYFQQSTPLDEIGALPLGSRPARRSGAASLDDLRAIPWVFAWNQSRQMVPGWFGAGRALQQLVRERGVPFVRKMREWPFFATTLDAMAVALATADMAIAAEYASLVEDQELARSIFRVIAMDYFRAVKAVCRIAQRPTLLAPGSTLARTIELRNPYVDPLSFIQVELLRRKRALVRDGKAVPQDLQRALLLTINGVAAGLRNTG